MHFIFIHDFQHLTRVSKRMFLILTYYKYTWERTPLVCNCYTSITYYASAAICISMPSSDHRKALEKLYLVRRPQSTIHCLGFGITSCKSDYLLPCLAIIILARGGKIIFFLSSFNIWIWYESLHRINESVKSTPICRKKLDNVSRKIYSHP